MNMDDDTWEDDVDDVDRTRSMLIVALAAVALAILVWLVVIPALDDTSTTVAVPTSRGTGAPTAGTGDAPDVSAASASASTSATASTVEDPVIASTAPETTATATAAPGTTEATVATSVASASPAPVTTSRATSTTRAPTTPRAPQSAEPVSYPTLPDGSPEPVVAIFDVDTITLSGTVPSDAAAERLEALALANSKTPASVVAYLAVDPTVPMNVPVRVIELTSARFPEGSAEIVPDHARELDRVATVMEALPNVTVLVVGHADQRGNELVNYRLSEQRAQAVVSYLVGRGIAPSRLASRAVGESDLLTLADDETALALNRRTEFVFSGLLVGS